MPLKPFQRNYWVTTSTVAPPPTPASRGGYPGFQIAVVASLWGACWDIVLVQWARLKWWLTTLRRLWTLDPFDIDQALAEAESPTAPAIEYVRVEVPVAAPAPVAHKKAPRTRVGGLLKAAKALHHLDPVQQGVIAKAVAALEHPSYALAQQAVQQTATTPGFHRSEAWRSLSHLLKADAGRAENMYRHVKATEITRQLSRETGSTLSNPQAHLMVELAYQSYTITGRH